MQKKQQTKKKQKTKRLYFRDKHLFHYKELTYFEGNKFNKYISTDIVQILLCIIEKKSNTFDVTQKILSKRTELENQMHLLDIGPKQRRVVH